MFLVEADGKRIWHTGDYRLHGYMGKGLFPMLRRYATDIDVLITEGTMLGRKDKCIHECEVSRKMASVMQAFKYVFVLASATDIERLASYQGGSRECKETFMHLVLVYEKGDEVFHREGVQPITWLVLLCTSVLYR